jgi:kinesin family protein 15
LHEDVIDVEFEVKCSYLEIYNEVIMDLLDPGQQRVVIRDNGEKGVYPDPCTEEQVQSISDVMAVINKGARNRHVGQTNMNQTSSRSHAIFTATIRMKQTLSTNECLYKSSRFHIVDLAGSERTKDTGAEGVRLKEAGAINKSLTVLGQVIYDLSEPGSKRHIRYRDSKLTYLLKDALGGNSKTVMICNINPHIDALRESKSTLQFA